MQVERIITQPMLDLKISGITLLTEKEARSLPKNIRKIEHNWWTKSPYPHEYGDVNRAFYVDESGKINDEEVNHEYGVRPALKIYDLQCSGLCVQSQFRLAGFEWTIISEHRALCNSMIGINVFNRGPIDRPNIDNNYETSDIKAELEKWCDRRGLVFDVPPIRRIALDIDWVFDPGNDDWDNLPSTVNIPNYVTDDGVADYLTDKYGFNVNSYVIEEI